MAVPNMSVEPYSIDAHLAGHTHYSGPRGSRHTAVRGLACKPGRQRPFPIKKGLMGRGVRSIDDYLARMRTRSTGI